MSLKIEDYALIGDGQTAALVGRDGSIDWLCWPRFDSSSCFARILGDEMNGRWLIAPVDADAKTSRAYRDKTLILETHYETAEGAAVVIDFLPVATRPDCHLVRIVRGLRGIGALPNGSRHPHQLRHRDPVDQTRRRRQPQRSRRPGCADSADAYRSCMPDDWRHRATFSRRRPAKREDFVLSYHLPVPTGAERHLQSQTALSKTEEIWRKWTHRFDQTGPYSAIVLQSLITLRALIYEPSGAIVAAPTTSLPEELGGGRNWDYRYCWLRDATFTLLALMNGGYVEEAKKWRRWLLRSIGGDPSPDPDHVRHRRRAAHSRKRGRRRWPATRTRSRSASATRPPGQLQIDIYGELLDALYQARKHAA